MKTSPFALPIFATAGSGRRQGSAMNSLRSALTAALAGQTRSQIRAKGDTEGACLATGYNHKERRLHKIADTPLVNVPEFYRQFDSTASTVRLEPSGQQTQDVKVIPQMAMETALSRLP